MYISGINDLPPSTSHVLGSQMYHHAQGYFSSQNCVKILELLFPKEKNNLTDT